MIPFPSSPTGLPPPEPARATAPAPADALFPVLLNLTNRRVLLMGGGTAGLELLTALLGTSPATAITVVSETFRPEILAFTAEYPHVLLREKAYAPHDLSGHDLILAATSDADLNQRIRAHATARHLLCHVADAPAQSDFYLGEAEPQGRGKIVVSTSSEPAARRRHTARAAGRDYESAAAAQWRRLATVSLLAFAAMLVFNILSYYLTWQQAWDMATGARLFYVFVAIGFGAQLIDGLLGMGYGVVTAISLMSLNIAPAAVSASIHTAEMFASGASGYHHYRFGNVNKRLFKVLLIPGVLGAVSGAYLLSRFGEQYAGYVKPLLAVYLLLLGLRILSKAFRRPGPRTKHKKLGLLAAAGGFLDSFGGGGWGPLVTSTLIAGGRTPQYVIGSVSVAEFFVTFASALTFFATIGITHWQIILGLIVGGVAAAPLAARLAGRIPTRWMFVGVGLMVIVWSLWALRKVVG
ncbi:siroheme synthase, N-terminal domain-containing protein [Hymenobacter daecheongensis DSM 21074]|uniref:Probable membrane transporter protein n=1 Tax=Hymenobacter daecheongensis DSM 21074 TaxID=1121955 RepID=A0A1M6EJ84_9BACT|nr:TSUP family transporter [Hymenobacter daecheongensis]SHI85491.1 siroheme synthase, N-terminal domain-containing protein [Hymenobacter daecheongensis DSM 21074]